MKTVTIGQNPKYAPLKMGTYDEEVVKSSKNRNGKLTADGWVDEIFDWDADTMKWVFGTQGTNMSSLAAGGTRKDAAVIKMNGVMLDYEGGKMTEAGIIEEQAVFGCASYAFASIRHKTSFENGQRLRLYLPFNKPLEDYNQHKALEKIILNKYRGDIDESTLERSRYFYNGNTEIFSNFVDGEFFDWERYIDANTPKPEAVDMDKHNSVKPKDVCYYRADDDVVTASGVTMKIKDLPINASILCPVCGDDKSLRSSPGMPNAIYGYSAHILKDTEGNAILDSTGNPIKRVDIRNLVIYCFSCSARNSGTAGDGIYNLHRDDVFMDEVQERGELVFADIKTTKFCSVGFYDGQGDVPVISADISADYRKNFLKKRSISFPESFPEMMLETSFDYKETVDFENSKVNKYYPSEYLRKKMPSGHIPNIPPYINKLVTHLFGGDEEIKGMFLNDLANFVQTRRKMITSYLVQGTQGTGKGLFFNHVISPMIGKDFCYSDSLDSFGKEFNTHLSNSLFILLNEVSVDFISDNKKDTVRERLKMAITDTEIGGEGKGKDRGKTKNICSFMFATNNRHGVQLEKNDRRFNVAPWQGKHIFEQDWYLGDAASEVKLADELQEFTWWLQESKVDRSKVNRVITNDSKKALQALSKTNEQDFFESIQEGDVDWLLDNTIEGSGYNSRENYMEMVAKINSLRHYDNTPMSDLCEIYNFINKKNLTTIGFGKLSTKNNVSTFRVPVRGKKTTCCKIEWQKVEMFD